MALSAKTSEQPRQGTSERHDEVTAGSLVSEKRPYHLLSFVLGRDVRKMRAVCLLRSLGPGYDRDRGGGGVVIAMAAPVHGMAGLGRNVYRLAKTGV